MKVNEAKKKIDAAIRLLKMAFGKKYNYDRLVYREDGLVNVALEIADDLKCKKISKTAISYAKSCMALAGFGKFYVIHCDKDEDNMVSYVRVYAIEQKEAA